MHVSLAYNFEVVSLNDCGKSLILIKKRSDPRTEPCGTPHISKPSSEKTPSIDAKNFPFERQDLNHLITAFLKPTHSIFFW